MPSALQPIESITISNSTTNSVTFSSLPDTYRDLRLIMSLQATTGDANLVNFLVNSDTNNNYLRAGFYSDENTDTVPVSWQLTDAVYSLSYVHAYGDISSSFIVDIFDYSASDKDKNFIIRSGAFTTVAETYRRGGVLMGARWDGTNPITSLTIQIGNYFSQNSKIDLYGIKG